jgi:prostaglandin-endoperoxide synthase 2
MILIVVLIRIVVEEYINHITGYWFRFSLDPASFKNEPWQRTNRMAIEFNLLYRWHSLVASPIEFGGAQLTIEQTLQNTDALIDAGLGRFMTDASQQRSGRIGLFNTDRFLVEKAERPSIEQGRRARLRSYNDYRELCHLPRAANFSEFSGDPRVGEGLRALYDSVDDVEFYVGLFAEQAGPTNVLPPLMTAMVSFDAFSQVYTNPLVAPRIFTEETFSKTGIEIIRSIRCIKDLVLWVTDVADDAFVSLTRADYRGP